MDPVSTLCVGLVASALSLAPVTGPVQYHSIEAYDAQLRVTERVLDRTICPDVERTRSVDKEAYPRMTERQKEVAASKAQRDKRRALSALVTHCKTSRRVIARGAVVECSGLVK